MLPIAIVAMFCEDIREEKAGTDTLVGILPDNMNVPSFPYSFPKLGLYTRIHLDPTFDPGPLSMFLHMPDETEIPLGAVDAELVSKARASAQAANRPICGLISRATMGNFTVPQAGIITAIIRADAEEHIAAALNVQLTPKG